MTKGYLRAGKALSDATSGVAEPHHQSTKTPPRSLAPEISLPLEEIFIAKSLNATEALLLVLDPAGRVVHFNSACERLSGYQAAEILGQPIWEVLTPASEIARTRSSFADLVKSGSTVVLETHWRPSDGKLRRIRWEQVCLRGIDGKVAYIVATGTDVTGRKASEASLKRELTLMHTLMENLPHRIYFKDRQSRFIRVNQAVAHRHGENEPDDLLGKTDFDYFTEEHARQAFADEQSIIATGVPLRIEEKETWPGLPDTWALTNKGPLRDADQNIIGTFGTSVDITERKTAEQEMRLRARLFVDLAEFAATVNAIHDPGLLAEVLIKAMSKVVPSSMVVITLLDRHDGQYYVRSVCGLSPEVVGSVIEVGEGTTGRAISEKAMVSTEPNSPGQFGAALRPYMPHESFYTVGVPLLREGAVLGAISVARADSELSFTSLEHEVLALLGAHAALALANAHLSEEVSVLAIHDGLTGLYNRRHFDAALELALARSKRGITSKPLSAIMFDLDYFGDFNEEHGHLGGDALLRHFAGLLEARLRAADIVARYGGEEFIAILEDCPLDNAIRLAEGVRRDLEESVILDASGGEMRATVSAGCAKLDPRDPSPEALIGAADQALYTAKRTGRNRVVANQPG